MDLRDHVAVPTYALVRRQPCPHIAPMPMRAPPMAAFRASFFLGIIRVNSPESFAAMKDPAISPITSMLPQPITWS